MTGRLVKTSGCCGTTMRRRRCRTVCLEEEGEPSLGDAQGTQESTGAASWPWLGATAEPEDVVWPWWPLWKAPWWWRWRPGWWRLGGDVWHWWRHLVGQDGFKVNLAVFLGLFGDLGDVLSVVALDQVHQLLRVFADDDRPEVASDVVPRHAVAVELVVLDGQASLVVILLQSFDRHSDVELSVDLAVLHALVVVRLPASSRLGSQ